ncbi:hypothetical protein EVAR_29452_1 [Eumeta japonica]|uniref:Uncharacterized protein n=1 Tax=Eumeta variegata TaxID=151549 RepID=A0A4C1VSH9_EUMVA|nr:hypothetical protein EVAR_29452_1 [Eumeta japonica]
MDINAKCARQRQVFDLLFARDWCFRRSDLGLSTLSAHVLVRDAYLHKFTLHKTIDYSNVVKTFERRKKKEERKKLERVSQRGVRRGSGQVSPGCDSDRSLQFNRPDIRSGQ